MHVDPVQTLCWFSLIPGGLTELECVVLTAMPTAVPTPESKITEIPPISKALRRSTYLAPIVTFGRTAPRFLMVGSPEPDMQC